MLATTTNVAIGRPNSAGIRSAPGSVAPLVTELVLISDIIVSLRSLGELTDKSRTGEKVMNCRRTAGHRHVMT